LDGLMQALETGSAFRDPSRPARKRQPRKGLISLSFVSIVNILQAKYKSL